MKQEKAVDCHCHLDFDRYDEDREEVIERAQERLEFIVNAGCSLERNRKTTELAEEHPDFVVPNLGIHPTFTDDFENIDEVKQQIRENDPAAIGEIGLDHHHVTDKENRERQRQVFSEFLKLAEELDKPVVVHSREAEQETIDTLKEYDIPEVMVHCFNGTPKQAREAVENNFTIGITTQVLYSNRVQCIVEELDIEDIVLETDSPFLYQGERNEPVNVVESAEKISELKDASIEDVIDATTRNARRIFR
jgi:TatD DNase family protein